MNWGLSGLGRRPHLVPRLPGEGGTVLTDAQRAALEPLVEACRPKGKTPPRELRRTMEAIVRRHRNGAAWRAIPAAYGPWWTAAPLFIRWAKLGARERLLGRAPARGVALGMAFLDGSSIRAHAEAAGAPEKGRARASGTAGRRSAARAAGSAPRSAEPIVRGRGTRAVAREGRA